MSFFTIISSAKIIHLKNRYKHCRRSERESRKSHRNSRKRRCSKDEDSESESDYSSQSESEYSDSEGSGSETESESEEERKRRKKRREREDKERRREEEEEKREKEKEEEKLERGKRGAVTNSWGEYGIIRETDMNKQPKFAAWSAEVKRIQHLHHFVAMDLIFYVNLESLPTWEEKQMFKEFMADHNTATIPSKKLELQQACEKQVEALKCSMQSGMAQAMSEQAQLREGMA